jgi:hypothetical protein
VRRRAAAGWLLAAFTWLVLAGMPAAVDAQTPPVPAPTRESLPAAIPPGPHISVLQAELQRQVDLYRTGGEYAVAVTDLQTGETISVNGNRPQLTACTISLMVLIQATMDMQSGRIHADDAPAIGRLIERTILTSNPVTARSLYQAAGRGDVLNGLRRTGTLIARVGMTDTILNHPPGFGRESLGINPNNWTTALDTNRALSALWDGSLLRTDWRDHLLNQMTVVTPGLNYLTAIVPGTVSHKNGFFQAYDGTFVDNDAGIVRFTHDGREYAYAISFFSQWVPVKYGDVVLGQSLSRTTWAFFQGRYASE